MGTGMEMGTDTTKARAATGIATGVEVAANGTPSLLQAFQKPGGIDT